MVIINIVVSSWVQDVWVKGYYYYYYYYYY